MYISVYFVPDNTPVILRLVRALEVDLQVFHKDVQAFTSSRRAVNSLENWGHLARFDRLEDLDDGLKMCFLYILLSVWAYHTILSLHRVLDLYELEGRVHRSN